MTLLSKNKANYSSLTPLSFLYRTAEIFPKRLAWIYGNRKANYRELFLRSKNLAVALKKLKVKKGNIVSVMLPNFEKKCAKNAIKNDFSGVFGVQISKKF